MEPSSQNFPASMPEAELARKELAMVRNKSCTSVNYNEYVTSCVRGQQFHLPQRYEIENCIGSGAYGIVV